MRQEILSMPFKAREGLLRHQSFGLFQAYSINFQILRYDTLLVS